MKPVRSSFPNALSPCLRRPASVLVAACRAVAALPLSLSPLAALAALPLSLSPLAAPCRSYYSAVLLLKPTYIYTHAIPRHTKDAGRSPASVRPASRRCCGTSSEYVRPPTAPDPR